MRARLVVALIALVAMVLPDALFVAPPPDGMCLAGGPAKSMPGTLCKVCCAALPALDRPPATAVVPKGRLAMIGLAEPHAAPAMPRARRTAHTARAPPRAAPIQA